jgi:hypothetical protein
MTNYAMTRRTRTSDSESVPKNLKPEGRRGTGRCNFGAYHDARAAFASES